MHPFFCEKQKQIKLLRSPPLNQPTAFPEPREQNNRQHCRRKVAGPAKRSARKQKFKSACNDCNCKHNFVLQKDLICSEDITRRKKV